MSFDQNYLHDLATRYVEAWNSRFPENVAACHAAGSRITINRGDSFVGHDELTAMAAGFYSDVPDYCLRSDAIRAAGTHVIFMWTFAGHHAETGNRLSVSGWEEWELDADMKITSSLGWFDEDDYQRQVDGRKS